MTTIIGHAEPLAWLDQHLHHNRAAQTYIFSGPQGIGKSLVAKRFVHAFLKKNSSIERQEPNDAIWRRMQAHSHGNFHYIHADVQKGQSDISVDAIRQGLTLFQQGVFEPGGRAMIIDSCDRLTLQGANCLLKTLEEPPANCLMILISHQPGKLLPTLKSRAQQVMFLPLTLQTSPFASLVGGSLGLLKRFEALLTPELMQQFHKGLGDLQKGYFETFKDLAEKWCSLEQEDDSLETLHLFLTLWLAEQISHKAQGLDYHPLYQKTDIPTLIEQWRALNNLFQQTYKANLDLKQTLILALKCLDPGYPLPMAVFQPWQYEE